MDNELNVANDYESKGENEHARKILADAVEPYAELLNGLAWQFYRIDSLGVAKKLSELALTLSPHNANMYHTNACIYRALGYDSLSFKSITNAILYDNNYKDSLKFFLRK